MIAHEQSLDEQVLATAKEFPGEVVRIVFSTGYDWSGDPAIFFRIVLSDQASDEDIFYEVTERISKRLVENLRLDDSESIPYFYFRSKSEQDKMTDPGWQSPTTC